MVILNKEQAGIEIERYKKECKMSIILPDSNWTKFHFAKSDYNLRTARINYNLNEHKEFIKELEKSREIDVDFNTYEWVIIMSYYAMFHAANALLRKIGVKIGKQYAHEVVTNLLLYYFYYTNVIEEELLKIYENAEEKAKQLVLSYIFAKEKRIKYQYEADSQSQKNDAKKILEDATNFVSHLKEIEKTISRELILRKLNKKNI